MRVEKITEKTYKLTVENDNFRITNYNREMFEVEIYVNVKYLDQYEEVGYDVWKYFVEDEIPKNKLEELTAKIKTLEEEKAELKDKLLEVEKEHGDYLLDNDLRITMLELGLA